MYSAGPPPMQVRLSGAKWFCLLGGAASRGGLEHTKILPLTTFDYNKHFFFAAFSFIFRLV